MLNIRGGPGTDFDTLDAGPLAKGTQVVVHRRQGAWCFANPTANPDLLGWVHGDFLRLT